MLRIERGIEKWWPEAGSLVGWGDGKREEWDRRVIGMTAWLHTTSGGHQHQPQHQTCRKQIHETHCLSGAADRQPGRQMDGRKNGIGSEWPPSTHNKSALHEEWYRDQKERGAVRASVWRSNIDQWMGRSVTHEDGNTTQSDRRGAVFLLSNSIQWWPHCPKIFRCFRCGRKNAKSDRYLRHSFPSVRTSVYPHGFTRLSLNGFSWNLIDDTSK